MTTPPIAAAVVGHPRRWYALAVLCVTLCMVVVDNTILTVAVPSIARELGADESGLQWITTAYGLVLAGLLLPLAVIGDRRGRKGLLLVGLAIFGVTSGVAATSGSVAVLATCRGLMGVGGACAMPATLSVLGNIFAEDERGRAIAIWSGTAGLAAAAGPLVGGLLLDRFWWGSVFLVNVPVAGIALVGGWILVPRSVDPQTPRLDLRSSAAWWGALTAAVVAIIEGPQRGWTSPVVLGATAASAALFAVFLANERRSERPLIDADTAADPRMRWGVATMTALFFSAYGSQFVLTQWLQGPKRQEALVAGLCFAPSAVGSIISSLRNPRLVARVGHGTVAAAGLTVGAVGTLGTAMAVQLGSIPGVAAGALFLGAGMGTAAPSAAELIMSSAPPTRAGSAAGVNETVVEAAGALGVAALGSVMVASGSYSWPLPVAAGLSVLVATGVRRSLGRRRACVAVSSTP